MEDLIIITAAIITLFLMHLPEKSKETKKDKT